jgi:short-subunit dehydrogenase
VVREELVDRYGVEILIVAADLSTPSGQEKLIEATSSLDIGLLVNNAGFATSGRMIDHPLDEEMNMLSVNVTAVLRLTHHFMRRFRERKRSGIVFLSSIVAFQGVPFATNYAASKAYVQSLAEGLAVECKPFNIDVLSATPGPVESGFGKRADMRMNGAMRPEQVAAPILYALGRSSGVVPGPLSKLLVYALRTAPRFLKIRIMQGVMAGFTKHQA